MHDDEEQVPDGLPAYIQQLARTYRFLDRYKERLSLSPEREPERFNELEDFLWSFFQNCWHVSDWIRNDDTLSRQVRDAVWEDVKQSRRLLIAADLANGSKHFARNPGREWVGARDRQIQMSENTNGRWTFTHEVAFPDGSRLSALQVAEDAMESWKEILARHQMYHFLESPAP